VNVLVVFNLLIAPNVPAVRQPATGAALAESPAIDFDAWYRSHAPAIYRRGQRFFADDALAWDLVQDTFVRARTYAHGYRGGSPLSWLLTIADRIALDRLRANKRREAQPLDDVELADNTPDALEHLGSQQRHALVRAVINTLDERSALILVRRFFDEMSIVDIASELDVNERTVRRSLEQSLERISSQVRAPTRTKR
jgi:RNA polymerase sigma-70 factor (ECF subfamily)